MRSMGKDAREALQACLAALNEARRFHFHPPGGNPLGLTIGYRTGKADSYDLAAAVGALLRADLTAAIGEAAPPVDPSTGRPANYRTVDGVWVTIADPD